MRFRATNLKAVLRQQGRTVTWLATVLGVTRPHVSRVCNGERTVSAAHAATASQWVGVPLDLLFEPVGVADAS